jgi:hypothetical protein
MALVKKKPACARAKIKILMPERTQRKANELNERAFRVFDLKQITLPGQDQDQKGSTAVPARLAKASNAPKPVSDSQIPALPMRCARIISPPRSEAIG